MTVRAASPSTSRRALRRAVAALRSGAPQTAERLLVELLAQDPQCAEGWQYRAVAAHQSQHPEVAEECFAQAALLAPGRADFALDYARFLLERGRPLEALERIEKGASDPAQAQRAALLAAEALLALGRAEDAAVRLRDCLKTHGEARSVRRRLVEVLQEFGWEDAAFDALGEALRRHPDDPEFGPLLVAAWRAGGRHPQASELSRRLAASPGSPAAAWLDLAIIAAQDGDTQQAIAHATEALHRDSTLGNAWLLLAELTDLPAEAFCERLPPAGAAPIQFARARILDRRGRYEAAWDAYREGNRLASSAQGSYDREQQDAYAAGIMRHLDAKFLSRGPFPGENAQATPVFVCAVPRSGTTLLEQMLAAHPAGSVRAGGEQRAIHRLLHRALIPKSVNDTGEGLAGLSDERLHALLSEWCRAVNARAGGSVYVTDKMPSNFFLLGLLHLAFPRAPIVLLERDPVAVACSCFTTAFAEGHAFSHALDTTAHYFQQFRRVVGHWESVLPEGRLLRIRYEELLQDPVNATAGLRAQMDLAWSDQMLAFHRRREPVSTASLLQVRKPLNPQAGEKWRRFEHWLAPWRSRLEDAYWQGR